MVVMSNVYLESYIICYRYLHSNETYASENAMTVSTIAEPALDAGGGADDEYLSVVSVHVAAATIGAEEDQFLAVSHQFNADDDFEC
jgi:hypothetical protein